MSLYKVVNPTAATNTATEQDSDHWIVSLRDSQIAKLREHRGEVGFPSKYTELGQEILQVYFAFCTLPDDVQKQAFANIDINKVPKNGSKK
jgi:hypothetical protein